MAFGLIIQRRSQVPSGGWPEWIGISGRNASEYAASHQDLALISNPSPIISIQTTKESARVFFFMRFIL